MKRNPGRFESHLATPLPLFPSLPPLCLPLRTASSIERGTLLLGLGLGFFVSSPLLGLGLSSTSLVVMFFFLLLLIRDVIYLSFLLRLILSSLLLFLFFFPSLLCLLFCSGNKAENLVVSSLYPCLVSIFNQCARAEGKDDSKLKIYVSI